MITYNFIITEDKVISSYLNILNEDDFLNKVWEWCWPDNLLDYLDENPQVLSIREELESWLLSTFIPEDLFHHYEDDHLNCFAFTVSDEKSEVAEYNEDRALTFVLNKIKEYYAL